MDTSSNSFLIIFSILRFPSDLNVGELSAYRMWVMFGEALQEFLSEQEKFFLNEHEKSHTWKRTDYMNLYFKVTHLTLYERSADV